MLNEPASSLNDEGRDLRRSKGMVIFGEDSTSLDDIQAENPLAAVRAAVETVLIIETEDLVSQNQRSRRQSSPPHTPTNERANEIQMMNPQSQLLARYSGRLIGSSESAYARLDALLQSMDLLPLFRREEKRDVIYIVAGRIQPIKGGEWTALILFVLTALSVLYVGTEMALSELAATNPALLEQILTRVEADGLALLAEFWRGLPYALSILLILGAHELGHYFMSRRHRVAASLPYFLPFPFGIFGTFGAAIRLREPMRNRKMLLDIGAAGPLAGLVFAIPILLYGLATSQVQPIPPAGMVEGNSILYALAKILTFGRFLPDGEVDVFVNQFAWAGWTGLFVTGLNLIPLGQLDGGHIIYSLVGARARSLYYPILIGMALLTVLSGGALLLLLALLFFMGRVYAVPLDDITPLDNRRIGLAILGLVIFALVFVPVPLTAYGQGGQPNPGSSIGLQFTIALIWLGQWWRTRRTNPYAHPGN